MKKIVQVWNTYGKSSGEELERQYAFDDTTEERKEIIENTKEFEDSEFWSEEDLDKFISGEDNSIRYTCDGDWDDPSGGFLKVLSLEDALREIDEEYLTNRQRIVDLFA